jgi:serine/threonine protein kinase
MNTYSRQRIRVTIGPPSRGVAPLHTEVSGTTPPDAFGPFRVLHQIGSGALGPVFRTYDSTRDRLVAVKLFSLDLPPERFHQLGSELEHLIAAGLTHPTIAAPRASGTDGITTYLAWDFVAADSLDVVVRDQGAAPAADALRVATQLAGALDFAAAVHVHHGSLHPRDVLIASDETWLTGLGVAQAVQAVGVTPPTRRPYMAPERAAGGSWDRRADIFSLAALIHELLWGRRLPAGGTEVVSGLAELPGWNLRQLRAVFSQALAENPADRFETALEFADALQMAFSSETPARPASPAEHHIATAPSSADLHMRVPADALRLPLDSPHEHDAPLLSLETAGVAPMAPEVVDSDSDPEPPADFELRAAEAARYDQIEEGPTVQDAAEPVDVPSPFVAHTLGDISKPAVDDSAIRRAPVRGLDLSRPEVEVDRTESPRRSWPGIAALFAAIVIGFGAGYVFRGQPVIAPPLATAVPPSAPARPGPDASPLRKEAADAPSTKVAAPKTPTAATAPPVRAPSDRTETKATAAAAGRLLVRSSPSGARVIVDRQDRGVTPATIRDLRIGAHQVRVLRDGYRTAERRVQITATRPAQSLAVDLERTTSAGARVTPPAPSTTDGTFVGTLTIESRPPGAEVRLDGKVVGTTPTVIPQVGAGQHTVRIELAGYRLWTASVRVVTGERNRVTASLER